MKDKVLYKIIKLVDEVERMKLTNEELEVLAILEENHQVSVETIAAMVNTTVVDTKAIIEKLESEKIIVSYPALIDWSKVEGKENIVAMIEVKVTPKRGVGFDEVAERIYRFPEVTSLYLMSGAYDLSLTIEGKSMTEIATFVSEKLSTIENVISTTTHFMLKKYKHDGVVFGGSKDTDRRMVVSP
jgi:DNA-binding Lrp family transcriptional regulator